MNNTFTYNFTVEKARLTDDKVEVLGRFEKQLDNNKAWIWVESLQKNMEAYCERSGDTLQQAVDRLNREIAERYAAAETIR